VRFEDSIAVIVKIIVYCDMIPFVLVDVFQRCVIITDVSQKEDE
jgi:hypothetical protein